MKFLAFRILIPLIIVILFMFCIKAGVAVSKRPELSDEPLSMLLFHAVSLFTFGAKDFGAPSYGPLMLQYILYGLYFIAPLITLVAMADVIYMVSKPYLPLLLLRGNHYIILGNGRVGKALTEVLTAENKVRIGNDDQPGKWMAGSRVVIVDKNVSEAESGFSILHTRKIFLNRDVSDEKQLRDLNLKNARGIFILTDNEWLNMKIYFAIKGMSTADSFNQKEILVRVISQNLLDSLTNKIASSHRLFNVHTEASKQLFDASDNAETKLSKERMQGWMNSGTEKQWMFFGFGRFSSSLLESIVKIDELKPQVGNVAIVDLHAKKAWKTYLLTHEKQVNIEPVTIDADINFLAEREEDLENFCHRDCIAVFSSDDETNNLKAAAWFKQRFRQNDNIKFIIRTRYSMAFPHHLLDELLGENRWILIPTYEWIKCYFEDFYGVTTK